MRQKPEFIPEWVDHGGLFQLFSIPRGIAYQLVRQNLINSVSMCRPGKVRGKRLFNVESVREYLAGRPQKAPFEWTAARNARRKKVQNGAK